MYFSFILISETCSISILYGSLELAINTNTNIKLLQTILLFKRNGNRIFAGYISRLESQNWEETSDKY
jgi:hypothetical protein